MPMSADRADVALNDALRGTATPHVWLHIANPTVTGTAGVAQYNAANIVRKAVTFAAPSNHPDNVERRVLSTTLIEWLGTEIDPSQSITHVSVWSALTAGQVEFIHALPSPVVVGSDGVRIEIGDIEHAIQVYAKPV